MEKSADCPCRRERRREEIMKACRTLYEKKGFHGISLKDISAMTSFSRPSIYNYFKTKEEIFLGILTEEYGLWEKSLKALSEKIKEKGPEKLKDFARLLGESMEERLVLLKISAMNLYEIEDQSSIEALIMLKKAYINCRVAFLQLMEVNFPKMTEGQREEIYLSFFPFIYGVHPYVYPTEKQKSALEQVGFQTPTRTITGLCINFFETMGNGFSEQSVEKEV